MRKTAPKTAPGRTNGSAPERRDPFRTLAIICIVVGILIVLTGAIVWYLTGRASPTIEGAGVTLAIGGGLRNMITDMVDRFPIYEPPPEDLPRRKSRRGE